MDRLTRKELKSDKFALEVGHTVEFLGEHKQQFVRYGVMALALVLVAAGWFYYNRHQRTARQRELRSAMVLMDASVGSASNTVNFSSLGNKNQAVAKALTDVASKYPGSDEGNIARYFLGTTALDQGNLGEAVKMLSQAAGSSSREDASLAKLTLAEIYGFQGKPAEAEKLLRPLIAQPTAVVSKEQATITLAKVLASSNPAEARKLLDPLRSAPGAVGRAASAAFDEIPANR